MRPDDGSLDETHALAACTGAAMAARVQAASACVSARLPSSGLGHHPRDDTRGLPRSACCIHHWGPRRGDKDQKKRQHAQVASASHCVCRKLNKLTVAKT